VCVYIHKQTMEFYSSVKKERSYIVCRKMDGNGDHHVEWDKLVSQRQVSHVFSHMWNLRGKRGGDLSFRGEGQ
jgi:hypothetical protein